MVPRPYGRSLQSFCRPADALQPTTCYHYLMQPPRLMRGLMALPQLAALALSFGISFEVSLCPPGMDMDMGTPMEMEAAAQEPTHGPGDCPFASAGGEHDMSCALAVGGIGPCGTSAAAPPTPTIAPTVFPAEYFVETAVPTGHVDVPRAIKLRPPRA